MKEKRNEKKCLGIVSDLYKHHDLYVTIFQGKLKNRQGKGNFFFHRPVALKC